MGYQNEPKFCSNFYTTKSSSEFVTKPAHESFGAGAGEGAPPGDGVVRFWGLKGDWGERPFELDRWQWAAWHCIAVKPKGGLLWGKPSSFLYVHKAQKALKISVDDCWVLSLNSGNL